MGIILRQNKGSELTFSEVDGNFQSLYYSSSLSGTNLSLFYASSSVTHSIDLGDVIPTGSFMITGSIIGNIITFTKADNTTFNITVPSGGGGGGSGIFIQTGSFYATTNDLQVTGSFNVLGDNTISGDISSSGGLYVESVTEDTDTNYKTVMYNPTTGQFFRTGSYSGGGSNTTYDYLAVGSIPSGVVNSPPMGTGYSSAVNVATTGGSGTGMTVNTVVSGGGVQTVTINNPGTGYVIGDNNIVISGGNGGAVITLSGTVGETNPSLRLIDSDFAFDDVKLTGGTNVTITRTGDTGITFDVAAASTDGIFNVITGTIFGTTSSLQVTGSTIQQSPFTTTGANITASNAGTGGGTDKYAMTVSESIWHYTDNIGVPTSKAWKTDLEGSYFNNFDHNTDTAEIVRFMAGLLSASAPDAAPNTRTYASLGVTTTNTGTGTAPVGNIPQSSTNDIINYLNSKGFATPGSTIFNGIGTIYNNSSYLKQYTSVAGSSTIVSSSNDAQLFGIGNIGQTFNVSGSDQYIYYDNAAKSPTTATSNSVHFLEKSYAGTANGLTIGDISTGNPLIPDAYQDGKFASIFQQNLYNGGISLTNITSSGYYYFSSSVGIQSGSSNYSDFFSQNQEIFYAPTTQINSGVPTNTPTIGYYGSASLSATSRSLSGAPYLQTSTWHSSASIRNAFNPLYDADTTFARINETNSLISRVNGGTGVYQGSTNGGTVQTSNFIYDESGNTARTIGTIPQETDLVKLTASLSFNAGTGGSENINQSGLGTTTYSTTDQCRNMVGSLITTNTNTYEFFKAGTFSQNASSGSMGYYGRAQGYDGGTLTAFNESFTGEDYRILITDNLLTGSYTDGDKPVTATYQEYVQDPLELQVKPGYLVEPGGSYGYWTPANASSGDYIYYARAFQRNLSTGAGSVTMSLGTTLQSWNSTSNGIAATIIFQSSGKENYSTPRIYDPTNTVDNFIEGNISNDDFKNPFTTNISLYGNVGGSISGTTYNVPMRNGDGMTLDNSDQDFIVIVRYKNDPTPITNINITIA